MARMIVQHREHFISLLLIEAGCLKAVGVEHHLVAATGAGFLFCGV
jgi:hypothetical protein